MFAQALNAPTDLTIALLTYYSFDLGGRTAKDIMQRWLNDYPAQWIYLATIEALYQGRYKALSVDQILAIWQRKGEVSYHFNHEFERLVCGSFSQKMHQTHSAKADVSSQGSLKNDTFTFFKIGKRSNLEQETANKADIAKIRAIAAQKASKDKPLLSNTNNPPIKRFNPPATDTNGFYGKLKAIARMVIR